MHGLINRSIQCFVQDTYGAQVWAEVAVSSNIGLSAFEAMLSYDDSLTYAVLDAIAVRLTKPRDDVMEDLGTYLVSHRNVAAVRRLLRFGGATYVEFLHSLDDLKDRAKLAVPDLNVPSFKLKDNGQGNFTLVCHWDHSGFGRVALGLLRGMADDYGALVFLEYEDTEAGFEKIIISVVESCFSEGRGFDLAKISGAET